MSEPLRQNLGKRLRNLREDRGLTQQQMADMLGKSIETISNFERGKTLPSLMTLERVAAVLRISMQAFFSDQVPASPPVGNNLRLEAESRRLSDEDRELLSEIAHLLERRAARRQ